MRDRDIIFSIQFPRMNLQSFFPRGIYNKDRRSWDGVKSCSERKIDIGWEESPTSCIARGVMNPPIFLLSFPYMVWCLYFVTNIIWYLQIHFTCDNVCQSRIGSSSCTPWELSWVRTFITFYSRRNGQTLLGRSGIARGLIKNNYR